MTMDDEDANGNPLLIAGPPPAGLPTPATAAPPSGEPVEPAPGFITLPPGMLPTASADSATHRLPSTRRMPPAAESHTTNDIVFFPGGPGTPTPQRPQEVSHSVPEGWQLVLADGRAVPLARTLIIGRDPVPPSEYPGAATLAIADPAKSLSKTHAVLEPDDGRIWVRDLHSTNGVLVQGADGSSIFLEPGERSPVTQGSSLRFGDYIIRFTHSD